MTTTITWKRNSALGGQRVTLDAYLNGERVGQIASTLTTSGSRAWEVWHGGTHRTPASAKAEVRYLVSRGEVMRPDFTPSI